MLPWFLCAVLIVVCWCYRRQRDAARANADRVWQQSLAGLAQAKDQVKKIESRLGGRP